MILREQYAIWAYADFQSIVLRVAVTFMQLSTGAAQILGLRIKLCLAENLSSQSIPSSARSGLEDLFVCFESGNEAGPCSDDAGCVFDIARAAQETPDTPAVDIVPEDAPGFLKVVLRRRGVHSTAPPNPTIREFTIELARIAGFQASKRQPLPGFLKLLAAWRIFAPQLLVYQTLKKEGMIKE